MKLFFDTCTIVDYLCNRQNAKCDYLIAINIHDFKDANMKDLRVITPLDFLSEIK